MSTASTSQPRPVVGTPPLQLSARRRRGVVLAVMTASFLSAMEATVVSTAMPTVIASLGGIDRYSWVFSAYILTSTVMLPLWGRFSDQFGRRRLILLAIAIFLVGSTAAGFARSIEALIVARAVQGLGAGGLMPLGMTVIGDLYTPTQRARMQAWFSSVWGLASIAGPLAGGLLTDHLSWRWVFFVNLPIGLGASALIYFALVESAPHRSRTIDWLGAGTLAVGATLLLLALTELGVAGLGGSLLGPLLLAASLVVGLWFVRVESTARSPLIPLGLLRMPTVRWPLIAAGLAGMAMFGAISFIPMFAQGVLGSSATGAGMTLSPFIFSWVATSIVTGRLIATVRVRTLCLSGFSLVVLGFLALSGIGPDTPRLVLIADMALLGAGMGLSMLCLLLVIQTVAPREYLGLATSLNIFFRSLGGAVGVALLGALLTTALREGLVAGAVSFQDANALLDPATRDTLGAAELEQIGAALAAGLHAVFVGAGVVSVLALAAATRLPALNLQQLEAAHRQSG
ncbi:MAG TPA: MDR family MFS transporter [Thermoanaerobaculia bacterium]|nr:MDR family MFS transporter [Thermoanaerobaculia bacterium]